MPPPAAFVIRPPITGLTLGKRIGRVYTPVDELAVAVNPRRDDFGRPPCRLIQIISDPREAGRRSAREVEDAVDQKREANPGKNANVHDRKLRR